jgi:hypothetical protein
MSGQDIASMNLPWRKSTRSANNGECVEVATTSGHVAVRDSKNPAEGLLKYSAEAWQTFVSRTREEGA